MKNHIMLLIPFLVLFLATSFAQAPYPAKKGENHLRLQVINQTIQDLPGLTLRFAPDHAPWLTAKDEVTIDLGAYHVGSVASKSVQLLDLPFEVAASSIGEPEIQLQLVYRGQVLGAFKVLLTFFSGDGNGSVSLSKGENTEEQSESLVDERGVISIPLAYGLSQNYPNPFNPETNIEVQLPENGWTVLKVYDILGRDVKTLVNREMPAGSHILVWDGANSEGRPVPSGVYIYRLTTSKFVSVRKMILVR
jgi:hypothetical protein